MRTKVFVINKNTTSLVYVPIMRGSVFGNKSRMRNSSAVERHRVIEIFKKYFDTQLEIEDSPIQVEFNRLLNLLLDTDQTINLGCVCKPKGCHGDHVAMRLNEAYNRIRANAQETIKPSIKRREL